MEKDWIPNLIRRAVIGGLIGIGITVGLHGFWAFVVGASNDYQLGQRYNPWQSFWSTFTWVVPLSLFASALTNSRKVKDIKDPNQFFWREINLNIDIPRPVIGAFWGALIGLGLTFGLWFVHGAIVGMSNDYVMYKNYHPMESFLVKGLFLIPPPMFLMAWLYRDR